MRSDVLKPIFPTKHRNLNAKSKESSGIEHLAVENSKYQRNARKFCSYLATCRESNIINHGEISLEKSK
jgi:hypothetical protein